MRANPDCDRCGELECSTNDEQQCRDCADLALLGAASDDSASKRRRISDRDEPDEAAGALVIDTSDSSDCRVVVPSTSDVIESVTELTKTAEDEPAADVKALTGLVPDPDVAVPTGIAPDPDVTVSIDIVPGRDDTMLTGTAAASAPNTDKDKTTAGGGKTDKTKADEIDEVFGADVFRRFVASVAKGDDEQRALMKVQRDLNAVEQRRPQQVVSEHELESDDELEGVCAAQPLPTAPPIDKFDDSVVLAYFESRAAKFRLEKADLVLIRRRYPAAIPYNTYNTHSKLSVPVSTIRWDGRDYAIGCRHMLQHVDTHPNCPYCDAAHGDAWCFLMPRPGCPSTCEFCEHYNQLPRAERKSKHIQQRRIQLIDEARDTKWTQRFTLLPGMINSADDVRELMALDSKFPDHHEAWMRNIQPDAQRVMERGSVTDMAVRVLNGRSQFVVKDIPWRKNLAWIEIGAYQIHQLYRIDLLRYAAALLVVLDDRHALHLGQDESVVLRAAVAETWYDAVVSVTELKFTIKQNKLPTTREEDRFHEVHPADRSAAQPIVALPEPRVEVMRIREIPKDDDDCSEADPTYVDTEGLPGKRRSSRGKRKTSTPSVPIPTTPSKSKAKRTGGKKKVTVTDYTTYVPEGSLYQHHSSSRTNTKINEAIQRLNMPRFIEHSTTPGQAKPWVLPMTALMAKKLARRTQDVRGVLDREEPRVMNGQWTTIRLPSAHLMSSISQYTAELFPMTPEPLLYEDDHDGGFATATPRPVEFTEEEASYVEFTTRLGLKQCSDILAAAQVLNKTKDGTKEALTHLIKNVALLLTRLAGSQADALVDSVTMVGLARRRSLYDPAQLPAGHDTDACARFRKRLGRDMIEPTCQTATAQMTRGKSTWDGYFVAAQEVHTYESPASS